MKRITILIAFLAVIIIIIAAKYIYKEPNNISKLNLSGEIITYDITKGIHTFINFSDDSIKVSQTFGYDNSGSEIHCSRAVLSDDPNIIYVDNWEKNYSDNGNLWCCYYKYDRKTNEAEFICSRPVSETVVNDPFACDGKKFYYIDDNTLKIFDIEAQTTDVLFEDVVSFDMQGGKILYKDKNDELYLYDIAADNEPKKIGISEKSYYSKFCLSPNGDSVAYVPSNSDTICIKNLVTGEEKSFETNNTDGLCFSPDGKYIAYGGSATDFKTIKKYYFAYELVVCDIDSGKKYRILTNGAPFTYICWK